MLKNMRSCWKRAVSGLLAMVMMIGLLPVSAFAADTDNPYAPTGSFELNVAGATAWNGGDKALTVYKTESGSTQATTIPVTAPFALLEDKGGNRLKIGYQDGGWTGANLDGTGWVDKDSVLVNLPDVLPSIAYESDKAELFSSSLTSFEYVIPGSYALAEQLAALQKEYMASGETLAVRQSGQTVSVSRAKGDPAQLHSYTLDGVTITDLHRVMLSIMSSIRKVFTARPTTEYRIACKSSTITESNTIRKSIQNRDTPMFCMWVYFFRIMAGISVPPLEAPT